MTDEKDNDENPLVRCIYAQQVQNMMDDPNLYYREGADHKAGMKYLQDKGIKIPNVPDDERAEDVKKAMYHAWHSIETLNMMCAVLGEQGKTPSETKVSRFENIF